MQNISSIYNGMHRTREKRNVLVLCTCILIGLFTLLVESQANENSFFPSDVSVNMSAPFDKQKRPKVGIGVIVTSKDHPGCVLIGKRKGAAPGEGQYALPGGHLEFGESWVECAVREVHEETGLRLKDVHYYTIVNAVEMDKDYHYITIFMKGEIESNCNQEPENLEPEKCEGWTWCTWEELPSQDKLFCPLRVFQQLGFHPFQTKETIHGS